MSKMAKRRRKAKKNRKTIANLTKSLNNIKPRVPVPPPGSAFKSIRDYDRRSNKRAVKAGLDE